MSKAKFDLGNSLAGILGNVSNPDAEEQITYIPLQNLVSDERNFYSMDGVDELAANIELIGLQQPLRVLAGENGFYVIVSGHRRAAAIRLLAEDAPEKWARVPCIVEKPGGSPELEELRLIMANADTRRMSSADLAKQAERVEMLLYKLKEQGMEFPGRMRDHVAEACKVSATKLAVLKVIREKLSDAWTKLYERNEIRESTAYKLAQLPPERQAEIYSVTYAAKPQCGVYESTVDQRNRDLDKIDAIMCDKLHPKRPCTNRGQMKEKLCKLDSWQSTNCRQCCDKCEQLISCKSACPLCLEKQKKLKKEKREENEKQKAERETVEKPKIDYLRLLWTRWDNARYLAGMSIDKARQVCNTYTDAKTAESIVHGLAKLKADDYSPYQWMQQRTLRGLCDAAKGLGVSLDYLLGRTDEPAPAVAPQQTLQFCSDGKPEFRVSDPPGGVLCWCCFEVPGGFKTFNAARFDPEIEKWRFKHGETIDAMCLGWYPLPE